MRWSFCCVSIVTHTTPHKSLQHHVHHVGVQVHVCMYHIHQFHHMSQFLVRQQGRCQCRASDLATTQTIPIHISMLTYHCISLSPDYQNP